MDGYGPHVLYINLLLHCIPVSHIVVHGDIAMWTGELIISPSAIHQARKDNRAALAAEIRESFDSNVPLAIHWDGKIMPDLTGTERGCVDRLPIMVSGKDVTKLLAIPKLKSGTAAVMSDACLAEIRSWDWKTESWPCVSTQRRATRVARTACASSWKRN